MAQVFWAKPALNDLREIVEYIAKDSVAYAQRLGMKIAQSPRRLHQFPLSGRIVPEFSDENIRELIYGSYRIIYLVQDNSCFITAIVHANRDVLRHLKPGEWDVTS